MNQLSRRTFAAAVTATALLPAADGWQDLFNGRDLEGWKPSENTGSWKVIDGTMAADGPRSHLFYNGPVMGADFKNFELEAEVWTMPGANSGIYFHTIFEQKGFPNKGFELQVNNTAAGEGNYRERKKTGSLYGLRNVYKQIAADQTWFKMNAIVRGKNIQVRVNGVLVVEYTEPTPAYVPKGHEPERFLDHGTFALQCHDPGSKARYRSFRVRPLAADAVAKSAAAPVVDATFRDVIDLGRNNIPLVDFAVQLNGGMTIEKALAEGMRDGFQRGIVAAVKDDRGAGKFVDSLQGKLMFAGWQFDPKVKLKSEMLRRFDYVWADGAGWDLEHAVSTLESQPIDICANLIDERPMWNEESLKRVLGVMKSNGIALQLSEKTRQPGAAVVRQAKQMGVKLSFGGGNRCVHGIAMVKECKLVWTDFWLPGAFMPKAAERKG